MAGWRWLEAFSVFPSRSLKNLASGYKLNLTKKIIYPAELSKRTFHAI